MNKMTPIQFSFRGDGLSFVLEPHRFLSIHLPLAAESVKEHHGFLIL